MLLATIKLSAGTQSIVESRVALQMLAAGYRDADPEFAADIETRLATVETEVELSGGSRPTKPGNGTTLARAKRG